MRTNLSPRNNPQAVSFDSATQSSAFGSTSKVIRVVATQPCYIAFGASPTALNTDLYLPAGVVEFFGVSPGQKLSALKVSSAGVLSITEGEA